MSAEIALRKKSTSERGIKLTVVLLASRKMLGMCVTLISVPTSFDTIPTDDPALDTRLTFIRRQSGLDYRAALFVLSPVSPGELSEFIKRFLAINRLCLCKSSTQALPAFSRRCTNLQSSITHRTQSASGASVIAMHKLLHHTFRRCRPSERRSLPVRYVRKVGQCVMSIKWRVSQSFVENTRLP